MGWNGSTGANAPKKVEPKAPSKMRGLVALAAVVVIGGIAAWFVFLGDAKPVAAPVKANPAKSIKEAKPVVLPAYRKVLTNDTNLIVLPNGVVTNKPKTIAEAISMVRLKPGIHRYKSVDEVFSKTNDFQIGPYKSLNLKTATESHLSLIADLSRDRLMPPMPPMPPVMDKDFNAALNNFLSAEEGDTAADLKKKKKIEMMKEMMLAYVDKGMTPSQALQEIEKDHNRSANLYHLYRNEYIKMARANDPDAAAFYTRATKELKSKGAPIFDENAKYIDEE